MSSCPCNGERRVGILSAGGDNESSIAECTGAGFVEKFDGAYTARRVHLVGKRKEGAVMIVIDFERSCSGISRLSDEHHICTRVDGFGSANVDVEGAFDVVGS